MQSKKRCHNAINDSICNLIMGFDNCEDRILICQVTEIIHFVWVLLIKKEKKGGLKCFPFCHGTSVS